MAPCPYGVEMDRDWPSEEHMGDVLVKRATMAGDKVEKLAIDLHGLPSRVIDRDTAVAWMRDGHSLIPVVGGERLAALQLVEVGDAHAIRTDNAAEDADTLPELPTV
jgi:hypothetical protein